MNDQPSLIARLKTTLTESSFEFGSDDQQVRILQQTPINGQNWCLIYVFTENDSVIAYDIIIGTLLKDKIADLNIPEGISIALEDDDNNEVVLHLQGNIVDDVSNEVINDIDTKVLAAITKNPYLRSIPDPIQALISNLEVAGNDLHLKYKALIELDATSQFFGLKHLQADCDFNLGNVESGKGNYDSAMSRE